MADLPRQLGMSSRPFAQHRLCIRRLMQGAGHCSLAFTHKEALRSLRWEVEDEGLLSFQAHEVLVQGIGPKEL